MFRSIFIITMLSLSFAVNAQNKGMITTELHDGKVTIERDMRVDTLVQRLIDENEKEPKIKGYRVQIYSGPSRTKANKTKAEFIINYPDEVVYLVYQQPNFKIRVGDYRNRLEALKMYHELMEHEDFKSVLLVPDEINLPELKD